MLVAMFSVGLVTFSKEDVFSQGDEVNTKPEALHPIWAVMTLLTVLLCITFRLTLVRKY